MCSRIQHQYEGAILTPALWKGDAIAGLEQIELDFTNIPPFKGQINPNLVLGKIQYFEDKIQYSQVEWILNYFRIFSDKETYEHVKWSFGKWC